jgi:phosphohistidine phosphatase
MVLYLVQHAEAKTELEDPARPLSDRGVQEISRVARHLSTLGLEVHGILHSGKLRAWQTAEALSRALTTSGNVRQTDGLAPLDDPRIWAERLSEREGSLMLVGHLPHLARLASLLLTGSADRAAVSFRMAGVLCLGRDEDSSWSVLWMVTPEILPA